LPFQTALALLMAMMSALLREVIRRLKRTRARRARGCIQHTIPS
jgi:hypothetical protein